jgi:hypothetical protein
LAWDALAAAPDARILIVGHTHRPMRFSGIWAPPPIDRPVPIEGRTLINPGAVGQSRDERIVARYARLDLADGTVVFREVRYDWWRTAARMAAHGLDPRLNKVRRGRWREVIDRWRARARVYTSSTRKVK